MDDSVSIDAFLMYHKIVERLDVPFIWHEYILARPVNQIPKGWDPTKDGSYQEYCKQFDVYKKDKPLWFRIHTEFADNWNYKVWEELDKEIDGDTFGQLETDVLEYNNDSNLVSVPRTVYIPKDKNRFSFAWLHNDENWAGFFRVRFEKKLSDDPEVQKDIKEIQDYMSQQ